MTVPNAGEDLRRTNRRQLVARGIAAIAGVVTLGATHHDTAQAATGGSLILGQTNESDQTTELHSLASPALNVDSLEAQELRARGGLTAGQINAGPSYGWPMEDQAAVVGSSSSRGVLGYASSISGAIGVEGIGRRNGVHGNAGGIGTGVRGDTGSIGVSGEGEAIGVEGTATGSSEFSVGVRGIINSGAGTAIEAVNRAGGVGLRVAGKACFSSVGSGSVKARETHATVANDTVTADSLILVTLQGNPGPNAVVRWVERRPKSGFIVHLSAKVANPTPFSYFVVEP